MERLRSLMSSLNSARAQRRQIRWALGKYFCSSFCPLSRGTKKTHPKINWNVNPLHCQGIISILSLGSVSLVFVKSSSTIFRDKEQSLNDQCRKKNPFRAGKMSTKINFWGNDKDCPELSELQDQTLCTDPGLPFLCHTETKPPAKHGEQWETLRNSWLGTTLIPWSLNSCPAP